PEEGSDVFQGLGARALFIAGTHRCANPNTPSGCSGTTNSCGGGSIAVRISDAPHFTGNFMYAGHGAALQMAPQPISLNLHGNSSEPVDVTLSDGTRVAGADTDLVQQLRGALLARSVNVGSCNWPPDGLTGQNLCGTTNAQGRLSNGSLEACTINAERASGLFLHIEHHQLILTPGGKNKLSGARRVGEPARASVPSGHDGTCTTLAARLPWLACQGCTNFPFPRGWYRYSRATCAHFAHVSLIFGGWYKTLCTNPHVVQADLIRSISFSPDLVSSQPSRALVIRRPAASAFSARTTRVWSGSPALVSQPSWRARSRDERRGLSSIERSTRSSSER